MGKIPSLLRLTSKIVDSLMASVPSSTSPPLLLSLLLLLLPLPTESEDDDDEDDENTMSEKNASKFILYPRPLVRTKRSRKYTHPPYAVALLVPLRIPPGGLRCKSASSEGLALSRFTVDALSLSLLSARRMNDARASLQFCTSRWRGYRAWLGWRGRVVAEGGYTHHYAWP